MPIPQGANSPQSKVLKTMTERMHPISRLHMLLDTALALSLRTGYRSVTRGAIARQAGVSPALVSHYFVNSERLHAAIMVAAVNNEVLPVIAQGLSVGDEIAERAPDNLKSQAARSLVQ